ncbi:MAG: PKD domain-containing protein [Anaerolineae bacterium]|nr:PKD domain-containing protein [Anaerolineae bacterium]
MSINLLGSVLYKTITSILVIAITATSTIPTTHQLANATEPRMETAQQLSALESTTQEVFGDMISNAGLDSEPVGFLLNGDVFQVTEESFESQSLVNPISISRMQSAFTAGTAVSNTLVITFTVTNNQAPVTMPAIPVTATMTDTMEAVSAIDFSQDPNVIHNVVLVDDLLPANATFLSADPMPNRDGDSLAWNLGNIPPLSSLTATLYVQIPTSVLTFTNLDTGAAAWGTLQGRTVSAESGPARLAPDDFNQWLIWTVDADYYDEYMVQKASELGNDWQAMLEYVRSLGYESYKGSLRGTRGTLWSEAGNSLDQASLLIAMLRGSGIPARYRHGTLETETAQSLILSMFPEVQGVIGHIPAGTEVADPVNDHHQDLMTARPDTDSPTGHTVLWDFGDGTTASGTLTPTHAYGDNGTYIVTLTVTDTTGLSAQDWMVVAVGNVAPSVSIWRLDD